MSDQEIDILQDIPTSTPGLDEKRNPPRDAGGNVVYPFRYEWNRPCQVHGLIRCTTVVFAPGKLSQRGDCGHNWDMKGNPIGKWLAADMRYWSKS